MNRVLFVVGLIAAVAVGCSESDEGVGGNGGGGDGGDGGMGGIIGPLTWTTPGLTVVGDDCGDEGFFVDEAAEYEITIDGSNVTLVDTDPEITFVLTTDDYTPEQDEVTVTGQVENDNFPPCIAELSDAFRMELDDPDVSLDMNDTLQVTWTHSEADVSEMAGDCEGEWFNPLPCSGEATFTLTQQVE